jgi:hypothetical protein
MHILRCEIGKNKDKRLTGWCNVPNSLVYETYNWFMKKNALVNPLSMFCQNKCLFNDKFCRGIKIFHTVIYRISMQ